MGTKLTTQAATEAHYAAIGRVATSWGYFEAQIDNWSHHFAGVEPDIGVCFTSQILGPRGKIDALMALIRLNDLSEKDEKVLKAFQGKIIGLAEQRNRTVHDWWPLNDPHSPQRLEATARGKLKLEMVSMSTADVAHLSENIEKLHSEMDELVSAIFSRIHIKSRARPQQ